VFDAFSKINDDRTFVIEPFSTLIG